MHCFVVVLNNDVYEDEIEDEHCPSEVVESLRAKRWVISTDEQVIIKFR